MIAPYHSVPNLTINATPTDVVGAKPKNCNKPDIVTSATPNPPGIILTAPAKEAKLKMNVACVMLIYPFESKDDKIHSNTLKKPSKSTQK